MRAFGLTKRINSIKFSLLSPDEIRKMSAVKVITADTYDDDGFPIDKGLMDLHMGVIEPGLRCKTCGGKVDECPGHFGHIELAMPVIHVGFVKNIKNYLDATCRECGRLKLTDEEIEMYKMKIEEAKKMGASPMQMFVLYKRIIDEAASRPICPHCQAEQKKITLDKPTTFREEGRKLTPKEIRERLERIPDDDLELMGVNPETARPEWMVLTVIAVPPVNVRPTITLETGERSEDDLTHKLVDIIRINQRLRENRDSGAPQLIIEDLWELLQYHVTTYFDNQTAGIPPARHRSGRPLKTLVQRLKGKEGRFRSNLSGKRVNFSSRTVISPEPFLSINEVGVPEKAARELTVPIAVTEQNIEKMREIIMRGPNPRDENGRYLPGANYVIRPDNRRIKITETNSEMVAKKLEVGWVVERHLTDGDIVLFNRQPSLHRMSMMGHRVKVMPYRTFRFNLAVCPPYNADFDGDEMNLHVIQGEEARAEARILMLVQEHILSPRFGGPIIGGIHDHITAMFLLTHKNPKFTKSEAVHILSYLNYDELPEPKIIDGKEYYMGKDLFSLILNKGVNIEFKSKICDPSVCGGTCMKEKCPIDAYVVIRDGKLVAGTIDENAIGSFKGKLLDKIVKVDKNLGRKFIDDLTRLAVGVISYIGFTSGIDDEDIPEDAKLQIMSVIKEAEDKVEKLIEHYKKGELQPLPGRSLEETLEMEIMGVLAKARDEAGKISAKYLGLENASVIMARSGARASMLNLSQMAGSIGQQSVRGQRLHRGYQDRTLPHFKRGDLGAKARGFVESSYKKGLNPTEYFFHSMGGREGLVDTAVRTSRSGYMQRRLINALEDLKVRDDGVVVDTGNNIIQFKYGEDGVDPTKSNWNEGINVEELLVDLFGEEYLERRKKK